MKTEKIQELKNTARTLLDYINFEDSHRVGLKLMGHTENTVAYRASLAKTEKLTVHRREIFAEITELHN